MSLLQRFSGMSLSSLTTYGVEDQANYRDMTDGELKEHWDYAIRSNQIIALENEVFERYLHRNDSQSLIPMAQVLETAMAMNSQMTQISSPHCRALASVGGFSVRERNTPLSPSASSIQTFFGSRGAQASIVQLSMRGLRIALSQRIEMANREIEEMRKELEEYEKQTIKKKANLCAQLEEIRMRMNDINKAREELEENVAKKGIDPSTGKIFAGKFIYYIEMWVKKADRTIEKLRLKRSTIKSQIRKAMTQLQQREELGESLHLIDFQALVIENEVYSQQIEEKGQQLMRLKKITGQYSLALSMHQGRLNELHITLSNTKKQIKIREIQIETLNSDLENIKLQIDKMKKRLDKCSQSHNANEMPNVAEIIKVQADLDEMRKTHSHLERHRSIQLIAIKAIEKHQQVIEQIKADATTSQK